MKTLSAVPFEAKRTALFELHNEQSGAANAWQGYAIPSHYESILEEHRAAREGLALFDIGYRGVVQLQGPQALGVIDELSTLSVEEMPVGVAWELPFVYPDGTLVDIVRVWRSEETVWQLIFSNPEYARALNWVSEQAHGSSCWLDDLSGQYAWICLAGRKAANYLQAQSPLLKKLEPGQAREVLLAGVAVQVWAGPSESFEIACQPELLSKVVRSWQRESLQPMLCGWASYENWRLECGVLRYGYELREGVNPFELGLDDRIDLGRTHFFGRSVLIEQQANFHNILVHFYIDAMRLPREQAPIYSGERRVGVVAAGGFGVELNRPIGSAWLTTDEVDFDNLQVEIRRQRYPIIIKKAPLV